MNHTQRNANRKIRQLQGVIVVYSLGALPFRAMCKHAPSLNQKVDVLIHSLKDNNLFQLALPTAQRARTALANNTDDDRRHFTKEKDEI